MTDKEAIEYLDKVVIDEKFGIDNMIKASDIVNICKEALEKQIAMRPITNLNYCTMCCPACRETIDTLYARDMRDKYCHNCRQKIEGSGGHEIS